MEYCLVLKHKTIPLSPCQLSDHTKLSVCIQWSLFIYDLTITIAHNKQNLMGKKKKDAL